MAVQELPRDLSQRADTHATRGPVVRQGSSNSTTVVGGVQSRVSVTGCALFGGALFGGSVWPASYSGVQRKEYTKVPTFRHC